MSFQFELFNLKRNPSSIYEHRESYPRGYQDSFRDPLKSHRQTSWFTRAETSRTIFVQRSRRFVIHTHMARLPWNLSSQREFQWHVHSLNFDYISLSNLCYHAYNIYYLFKRVTSPINPSVVTDCLLNSMIYEDLLFCSSFSN